jgi:hypothetical protein
MKTLKLLLFLLLVSLSSLSQIKPYAEFEGGLTNWNHSMYTYNAGNHTVKSSPVSYYSSILIGLSYNNFHLENTIDTYFDKSQESKYTFKPLESNYMFNLHYDFKRLQLGVKHECTHPILSNMNETTNYYRATYNKIYFKIKIGN